MVKQCSWGTCTTDSRYPDRLKGGGYCIYALSEQGRDMEKSRKCIRYPDLVKVIGIMTMDPLGNFVKKHVFKIHCPLIINQVA